MNTLAALTFALLVTQSSPQAIAAPKPAEPFARFVLAVDTKMAGLPVKPGDPIKSDGVVLVGPSGRARIELLPSKTAIQLGAGASFILSRGEQGKPLEMVQNAGTMRWKVNERAQGGKHSFRVRTQSAVMGVRGTDFMTVYNPLLDESEIIVFEGEVELQSRSDSSDRKNIPKEHWGGIGGRYGKKIGELIRLTPSLIETFDKLSRVE